MNSLINLIFTNQQYSSKKTSINKNKVPAIFKKIHWVKGNINCDYGGGIYDTATEYLAQYGVINYIIDPYNRSCEHNNICVSKIIDNGLSNTITCSNVLNVIKEPEIILKVIQNCYDLLKNNGVGYFTIYAGDGSGNAKQTCNGWQNNKKISDYIIPIKTIFNHVKYKNNMIIAYKNNVEVHNEPKKKS